MAVEQQKTSKRKKGGNNMRKILLLLAAACLLVLAACGGGSNNTPVGGDGSDSNDPALIRIAAKDFPPEDENSQKILNAIEEGLAKQGKHVKLELVEVQSGTYSEKLGLVLQTGNIPDLIYFQGGDYQFAITQQILEDLTPYIENSVHLKASLSEYNVERMKNYPYLVWPAPTTTSVPVVRTDWFDNTESGQRLLDNPTIDNYYEFFKEVKEKNGADFAMTTAGNLVEIDVIFQQAFGLTSTWIQNDAGDYEYGLVTDYNKDKLEFYAKLYADGLFDPEYLTKQWDTKEKAFYDGNAAVISGRQGGVIDIYNNKMLGQNGVGVRPLPPAKGVGQGYIPIDVSKEGRGFAISNTSEHKDLAFAVLEFMASPEGLMIDQLGFEGSEYEIVDGQIKLTDKFEAWYPHFIENTINFNPELEFHPDTPHMSPAAAESLELVANHTNSDNMFVIPADLASRWDASTAVYEEFAADVVTGKRSVADFDQFVEDWYAAGGKDITEYANEILK